MERLDIIMYLALIGAIFPYCLLFIYWLHNTLIKRRLLHITTIQDFRKKVKSLGQDKWVESRIQDVMREILDRREIITITLRRLVTILSIILFFNVNVVLVKHILYYYAVTKIDYIVPSSFPKSEVATLIALAVWISLIAGSKLFNARIEIYIEKIREFECTEEENLKSDGGSPNI